jgi:hypothetical protein
MPAVCGQLHLFNHIFLKNEKITITPKEMVWDLKVLKQSLEDRRNNYPHKAKLSLKEPEDTRDIKASKITKEAVAFCATCISYNEMWEGNFQKVESFSWTN